jgi:transposase InsO family protein
MLQALYMSYTINPHLPRLRMQAVKLIRAGWSYRKVSRHTGFSIGAISNWVKKATPYGRNGLWIPTESSRPKHHPRQLTSEVVAAILAERQAHGRCADVIYQTLLRRGIIVSLSSVKRTLDRHHLLKKNSPWKKLHRSFPRPDVVQPGDLVEVDTIHFWQPVRFYVYTILDVYSRWAWAAVRNHARTRDSLWFVREAMEQAPFSFTTLQSDHGSEFASGFSLRIGVPVRHSRVRKPNDNAHLERFNRTLQEECFGWAQPHPKRYQQLLPEYLHYYNHERLHMGLNFKTPEEVFRSY